MNAELTFSIYQAEIERKSIKANVYQRMFGLN